MIKDYADYLDQVFDSRIARLDTQFGIDYQNLTDIGLVIATLNTGIRDQSNVIAEAKVDYNN